MAEGRKGFFGRPVEGLCQDPQQYRVRDRLHFQWFFRH